MTSDQPRMTTQTLKVLETILTAKEPLCGSQIAKATKLPSGSLYPILLRLEKARWLESDWEEVDAKEAGRPRRRFYKVTGLGAVRARAEGRELHAVTGRLAWA